MRRNREHKTISQKSFPDTPRFAFRKHMIIDRHFEPLLQENGLDNFDAVMEARGAETVKQKLRERSTVKLYLTNGVNNAELYLKRYLFPGVFSLLKNCLRFSRTYSAVHEWRNILALRASNIPTMRPVAVGMRHRRLLLIDSFLLTEGIPHTTTVERIAETHFLPPLNQTLVKQKRKLIKHVASLTRKMHEHGFKHQDFYLCHILVNWTDPENPLLYVADLHRVRKKNQSKNKWKVKDLAALNFSAPGSIISRTDRLRFLKEYDQGLGANRPFVEAIARKTERIRSHVAGKRG